MKDEERQQGVFLSFFFIPHPSSLILSDESLPRVDSWKSRTFGTTDLDTRLPTLYPHSSRPLWFRKIGSSPDFWHWQGETALTIHFSRQDQFLVKIHPSRASLFPLERTSW
jgi:hypothetical protein